MAAPRYRTATAVAADVGRAAGSDPVRPRTARLTSRSGPGTQSRRRSQPLRAKGAATATAATTATRTGPPWLRAHRPMAVRELSLVAELLMSAKGDSLCQSGVSG